MNRRVEYTIEELAEIDECPCEVCSSQDDHPFLTATQEDLDKLPPISKELEDELRNIARKLRKRAEEEWEKELLQTPLKNPNLKENKENGNPV